MDTSSRWTLSINEASPTGQQERRTRLRALDDPQTMSTRARLVSAFSSAFAERVDRVSIRWLCDRAGVARSTYYTHFSSVADLAAYALTEDFDVVARNDVEVRAHGTAGAVAAHDGIERVVRVLVDRRDLLEYTFSVAMRPAVVESMIAWFATYVEATVAAHYPDRDASRLEIVVTFISAGMVHSVLDWIESPSAVPESDLVDDLVALLPARVRTPDVGLASGTAEH